MNIKQGDFKNDCMFYPWSIYNAQTDKYNQQMASNDLNHGSKIVNYVEIGYPWFYRF